MFLFVGDLHVTDKDRDAYRFKIFSWIKKQQEQNHITATFLAGDLTDAKDRHSATLVNQTVAGLTQLKPPVYICRGNHDYRDPDNPFFKFLSNIPGITFVNKPTMVTHRWSVGIIPHYRTQEEFDGAVSAVKNADCYLVHQTFEGAIAETGARLSGLGASLIESLKPKLGVIAGDVHRPQQSGVVTYIGCPYHVRFGDDFNPRCLLFDGKKFNKLYFDAPFKHSLIIRDADDILNNSRLSDGDQVKLTVEVPREEAVEWKYIKTKVLEACREMGVDVYACKLEIKTSKVKERKLVTEAQSGDDIFLQFCRTENVAKAIQEAGERIRRSFNGL